MIRIAICDDSSWSLDNIARNVHNSIKKYLTDFCVYKYHNGIILLNEHKKDPFDIVFLDIDMPNLSGFDIAKEFRCMKKNCFIIFVTNHSELVYESMDFQPFNFIRKNCEISLEDSIERIVKKLMHHMRQHEKIILESDLSGKVAVNICDIAYIESDKHYVIYNIVGRAQPIKIRDSLKACEEKYAEFDFIKIHKSFLVNLKYISSFDYSDDQITLGIVSKKLPLSKNYKKVVDERYTLYLRSTL